MRLIDADAYAKEMRERQDACEAAINAESYEGETFSLRQHWEGVFAAFVEAKLTLDSMPTVEMPGWISVKDRLPERDGLYLCWSAINCGEACYQIHLWKDGRWYWAHDVRYWMPLPEMPEENSNEI